MKPVKLCTALATALLLALPMSAFAQDAEEEESPFSATFTATSDYVFRGVSQTDNKPAFQVGATYSAPFGLYAGAWASNVDFGRGGPDIEVDYFVGWNKDLNDSWNIDLGVNRYTYERASSDYGDIDYNEYLAKVTWSGPVTVGGILAYADDYSNTGAEEIYAGVSASYDIGDSGFSVGASTGYTSIDYGTEGRADYYDGSITVSKSFGKATATLGYYDTFGSDASELRSASDIYKPGLVFTIGIAVP
ncbi:TorF family putative porin [Pseudoxanthomonas sp. LjRoot125]|uniref:TorF family putative porin n=1 Tax=Pseudoxanthomonas sp. LjRoot125 TaxID=3342258 RepID=UPI003E120E4C